MCARSLLSQKSLEEDSHIRLVLGYRQVVAYLDKHWLTTRPRSRQGQARALQRLLQEYQAASRQFARRQVNTLIMHVDVDVHT